VASSSHTGVCRTVGTADLHGIYLSYACQSDVHNDDNFPSLAPSTALNKSKISPTLRFLTRISPSMILPSSTNRRRATPGRHPTWRDGVTHRSSRQKAMLRMEVSITRPSARYSATSLGVPGSIPTAGIPTLVRARLYVSRRVVFVLVKTEGIVGSVSRYTETRGFDVTKAEVGSNVAATKRSSSSLNLGMGVDSTEIFPCRQRRMRIYEAMRLEVKSHDTLVQHLVGLTKIPVFQGRITPTLEPIKREF